MKKEKIILILNGKIPNWKNILFFLKNYDSIICTDGAANKIISSMSSINTSYFSIEAKIPLVESFITWVNKYICNNQQGYKKK